ncbi:MAG: hypothetical protein V3T77_02395 [Planctomycetota bacterium]
MWRTRSLLFGLFCLLALPPGLLAQDASSQYYRAYYLQQEQRDVAGALPLYEALAADSSADAELRAKARAHAEECREDLAAQDLARLMPPSALAYVELRQPAEQLLRLARMLGVLKEDGAEPGNRIAIHPTLIRDLIGVGGAALAITGFENEDPEGIIILHPGDLKVVRAFIESVLPVASPLAEPIHGYETYHIDNEIFVTLTSRMVFASAQRWNIEAAIGRLKGKVRESLAGSSMLAEARRDDSLLFFAVNFQSFLPLLEEQVGHSQEFAALQSILDLRHLKGLAGGLGVTENGVQLDVTLRLDENHKNLAFNFVQLPPLDMECLRHVPRGAAAFLSVALNEAGSGSPTPSAESAPPLSALDLGREIFANIAGISLFLLPGTQDPAPGVAAVITVRDPAKSTELWSQILRLGSMASGADLEAAGTVEQIDGVVAHVYPIRRGPNIYLANEGNILVLTPNKTALTRSLAAQRNRATVLEDPAFQSSISRLGPSSTLALFVHPARAIEFAKPFMGKHDSQQIEPFLDSLSDTVASMVMDHSREKLHLSLEIDGIPRVGPIVSKIIAHDSTSPTPACGSQA